MTNNLVIAFQCMYAVSYTHLDVYKRQVKAESITGLSSNVKLLKWAPQQEILGNICIKQTKVFYFLEKQIKNSEGKLQ